MKTIETTPIPTVNSEICRYDATNIYKVEDGDQKYPQPQEPDYLNTHYYFSPFLSFGDYDNSCNVERSNVRIWEEMFSDSKDWVKITGQYGYKAIGIRLNSEDPEIIETLEALQVYPCIDDEDCSLVTFEMEQEALDSYLLRDLKDKIIKYYNADDTEAEDDEFMKLYFELKESTNTYESIECGGNFYIDIDRLIEGLPEERPTNLKLTNY